MQNHLLYIFPCMAMVSEGFPGNPSTAAGPQHDQMHLWDSLKQWDTERNIPRVPMASCWKKEQEGGQRQSQKQGHEQTPPPQPAEKGSQAACPDLRSSLNSAREKHSRFLSYLLIFFFQYSKSSLQRQVS